MVSRLYKFTISKPPNQAKAGYLSSCHVFFLSFHFLLFDINSCEPLLLGRFFCSIGPLTPRPPISRNFTRMGPRSLKNALQGFGPPWGAQPRAGVCGGGRTGGRRRYAHTRERGHRRRAGRAVFGGEKGRLPGGVCRVPAFQAARESPGGGRKRPVFARFLSLVHKPRGAGLCSKSGCYFAAAER